MQGTREERGNGSGSENAREIFLGMDGDDRAYLRYLTVLNTRTKSLRTSYFAFSFSCSPHGTPLQTGQHIMISLPPLIGC